MFLPWERMGPPASLRIRREGAGAGPCRADAPFSGRPGRASRSVWGPAAGRGRRRGGEGAGKQNCPHIGKAGGRTEAWRHRPPFPPCRAAVRTGAPEAAKQGVSLRREDLRRPRRGTEARAFAAGKGALPIPRGDPGQSRPSSGRPRPSLPDSRQPVSAWGRRDGASDGEGLNRNFPILKENTIRRGWTFPRRGDIIKPWEGPPYRYPKGRGFYALLRAALPPLRPYL